MQYVIFWSITISAIWLINYFIDRFVFKKITSKQNKIMKTIKVVLGVILGISAIVTLAGVSGGEAHGAGLVGSLTGFLFIGGLAAWLIYNGMKSDTKKK